MKLSDKVYDILKRIVTIVIPAILTFYGVVGTTCNIPYTQEVLTIGTAFDTMLGTILGISTISYNKSKQL